MHKNLNFRSRHENARKAVLDESNCLVKASQFSSKPERLPRQAQPTRRSILRCQSSIIKCIYTYSWWEHQLNSNVVPSQWQILCCRVHFKYYDVVCMLNWNFCYRDWFWLWGLWIDDVWNIFFYFIIWWFSSKFTNILKQEFFIIKKTHLFKSQVE